MYLKYTSDSGFIYMYIFTVGFTQFSENCFIDISDNGFICIGTRLSFHMHLLSSWVFKEPQSPVSNNFLLFLQIHKYIFVLKYAFQMEK